MHFEVIVGHPVGRLRTRLSQIAPPTNPSVCGARDRQIDEVRWGRDGGWIDHGNVGGCYRERKRKEGGRQGHTRGGAGGVEINHCTLLPLPMSSVISPNRKRYIRSFGASVFELLYVGFPK